MPMDRETLEGLVQLHYLVERGSWRGVLVEDKRPSPVFIDKSLLDGSVHWDTPLGGVEKCPRAMMMATGQNSQQGSETRGARSLLFGLQTPEITPFVLSSSSG